MAELLGFLWALLPKGVPHPCVLCTGGRRCCLGYLVCPNTAARVWGRSSFTRSRSQSSEIEPSGAGIADCGPSLPTSAAKAELKTGRYRSGEPLRHPKSSVKIAGSDKEGHRALLDRTAPSARLRAGGRLSPHEHLGKCAPQRWMTLWAVPHVTESGICCFKPPPVADTVTE